MKGRLVVLPSASPRTPVAEAALCDPVDDPSWVARMINGFRERLR